MNARCSVEIFRVTCVMLIVVMVVLLMYYSKSTYRVSRHAQSAFGSII